MTENSVFLGLDAGGSKTAAVVANKQGKILGRARGGAGNFEFIGKVAAGKVVAQVVKKALSQAKRLQADVAGACFGMAGADREEDHHIVAGFLKKAMPKISGTVVNDARPVLRLALGSGGGIAIISGTGVNSVAVNPAGKSESLAGWLWSGAGGLAVGRLGLDLAIESFDGRGPKSKLEQLLCRHYKLKKLEDIQALMYHDRGDRALDIRRLVPQVFHAARLGDKPCIDLLREQGRLMSIMALTLHRKLFKKGERPPVVVGGSLLQNGNPPLIADSLKQNLRKALPGTRFMVPLDDPVMGALMLAFDFAGIDVPARLEKK